jgi:hypothetical protein
MVRGTGAMLDLETLARLRKRILFYRDSDDIVLGVAEVRTILDALDALAVERDAALAKFIEFEHATARAFAGQIVLLEAAEARVRTLEKVLGAQEERIHGPQA